MMVRRGSLLVVIFLSFTSSLVKGQNPTQIINVVWDAQHQAIHILLSSWPSVWPGWTVYIDGVEVPKVESPGSPVIRPDAPLSKPPTGLFIGTLPWITGLTEVDFPCCGTIQLAIPGQGLTNTYQYDLRDYGCRTASKKVCGSVAFAGTRGDQPWALAISPDGQRVYVPCWMSDNVYVIDTNTNAVVDVIDLSKVGSSGAGPRGAGVTPDGRKLYVVNARNNDISVIDTATNRIVGSVYLGEREREIAAARYRAAPSTGDPHRPGKVVFTPDGRFAYTVLYTSLLIIDVAQDKLVGRRLFEQGFYPFDLAVTRDGRRLYIGGTSPSPTDPNCRVYVLDTTSNWFVQTFSIAAPVHGRAGLALSPDGRTLVLTSGDPFVLYEAGSGYNAVYLVDLVTRSVVRELPVKGGPLRVALSPDGRKAYVVTMATPELLVIDLAERRLEAPIYVAGPTKGWTDKVDLVITPDGRYAYIAALDEDGVIAVDLAQKKMIRFIPFNPLLVKPRFIALSPDETTLYLGGESRIMVVNTRDGRVTAEIFVPGAGGGFALTPDGRFIYVAQGEKVAVVSTATRAVVGNVALADDWAKSVAIGPGAGKAYVIGMQRVHVVDLTSHRLIGTIDIRGKIEGASFNPAGSMLYVPLEGGGVACVDTSSDRVVSTIRPPKAMGVEAPNGLAVSPDGKRVYWGYFYDYLHVIDVGRGTIIRTMHLGAARWEADCSPTAIATTSDGAKLLITMHDGNYVAVLDAPRLEVIAAIEVGFSPTAIAVTRDSKLAYVVNSRSEDVSVIDLVANRVVRTISVRPQSRG